MEVFPSRRSAQVRSNGLILFEVFTKTARFMARIVAHLPVICLFLAFRPKNQAILSFCSR